MKRSLRLTRNEDIRLVRQEGQSYPHKLFVLIVLPIEVAENKTAVIAGRSVGGAVHRNFAKRRLRSAFQTFQPSLDQGYHIVLIARRPIIKADFSRLLKGMQTLLSHAGLMKENKINID